MLRWIGMLEICFVFPVIRSVSSEISFLTAAAWTENKATFHYLQLLTVKISTNKQPLVNCQIYNFQFFILRKHVSHLELK